MELLFSYLLFFYLILGVHLGLLYILKRFGHFDLITIIILMFFSIYFCCLGFWEIYTTSNTVFIVELGYIPPIPSQYYILGFYGIEGFSLYGLCFIFYLYHLKKSLKIVSKIKILIFIFILMGIQLESGLIGDFMFFLIKGLEFFNSNYAYWLGWQNNFPIAYLSQFLSGLWFFLIAIFLNYISKKMCLKPKT